MTGVGVENKKYSYGYFPKILQAFLENTMERVGIWGSQEKQILTKDN